MVSAKRSESAMNEVGQMLDRRVYRGLAFELWTRQGAWFWRLQQPRDVGGVIGAAGSEAEATEEARATIEAIEAKASCSKINRCCAMAVCYAGG